MKKVFEKYLIAQLTIPEFFSEAFASPAYMVATPINLNGNFMHPPFQLGSFSL